MVVSRQCDSCHHLALEYVKTRALFVLRLLLPSKISTTILSLRLYLEVLDFDVDKIGCIGIGIRKS